MSKKIIAMILAGGKGTRLEFLTKKTAKPAVSFAAKYRIIDFPISNCANSGIDVVGVLTQYESTELDNYIGNGEKWGLNGLHSTMAAIPPRQTEEGANWYKGTADAITQNIDFIDKYNPDHVLILSGDHIYKCTFNEMLHLHESAKADATISVIKVPLKEASRFGLMITNEKDEIVNFQEKPKKPLSDLASMGIYIFSWKVLREYLIRDKNDPSSEHDFGKNIIPAMLNDKKKLQVYRFEGYWRDVGTLSSLHEANMDIALDGREFDLYDGDRSTTVYTEDSYAIPQYIGPRGSITRSIANQGSTILGSIDSCVVSSDVVVEEGAECSRCVIMNGAKVKKGAKIKNAIIAPGAIIKANSEVNLDSDEVVLISK